jgi:ABC-type multidrug transport system ATPase subunit
VLDEPTNYLDRDSLGAFSIAIKDFEGGVLLITHNAEFANAICTETWLVENGKLNVSGDSWTKDEKIKEKEAVTEITDAAGNVIKIAEKVKISKADMKKRIKQRLKKASANQELSDVEDWMEECCKVRRGGGVEASQPGPLHTRAWLRFLDCSLSSCFFPLLPPPLHTRSAGDGR